MKTQTDIVIVTGISGAGKSIVLRTLEDLGFFCIDNLPSILLPAFFDGTAQVPAQRIAFGIDIRTGSVQEILDRLHELRELHKRTGQSSVSIKTIFLTASLDVLVKRFHETRRQHPLVGTLTLQEALHEEKQLLKPLELTADHCIDTDRLTLHQLRSIIRNLFAPESTPPLVVTLTSFGFKYGVPAESNFVFDLRLLPNPFFIPELKLLDGKHHAVQDYLFSQAMVKEYWEKLVDFFTCSLHHAYQEGIWFLQVAVGCTGGRHRSVAFVEKLASLHCPEVQFLVKHRDITKDITQDNIANITGNNHEATS